VWILGRNNTETKIDDATFKDGVRFRSPVSATAQVHLEVQRQADGDTIKGRSRSSAMAVDPVPRLGSQREKADKA
jgi:hypothetical protein